MGRMLTEERNRLLAEVSAGTPMGDLLRRYWMPIAGASEFEHTPVKALRLMGEDLVLYRDLSGTFGLVDRHCPHRRADLSYGFVEECGLRCNYHGWLFDTDGRTLEQPFEDVANPDARYRDKVHVKSYPVAVKAGLVWAYMGPQPAPLVPNWEPFLWKNGFAQIVISEIPCNWFQCQENSIDPVHFEWMHRNWSIRLRGETGPYAPKHLKIAFEEFEYGHVYKRVTEDAGEDNDLWSVGRVCLWPNALFTGSHFEWRIPIDDENTLSITWHFSRVPTEQEPYVQTTIPTWHGPIKDARTGKWITSHVMNQDFVAWLGQGAIADRTKEHLGTSDRGIIMIRKRYLDDIDAMARGEDPKAIVRDPAVNARIDLPIINKRQFIDGMPLREYNNNVNNAASTRSYIFQVGQPEDVRRAWQDAMGFERIEPAGGVLEMLASQSQRR
jgi:5,5'-dehydrodivanillate O-demethylase oxygenase subunit